MTRESSRSDTHQRICRVVGRLWNKDPLTAHSRLDEMMSPNIYHDLCPRINLSVQLLLQLLNCLSKAAVSNAKPGR